MMKQSFRSTGGATRTPDTWFWRPVLYQLSYTRVSCIGKFINPLRENLPDVGIFIQLW